MLVAVLNADWARQPDKANAISGLRSGRKRGKLAAFRDGSTRLAQKRFLGHDLCHDFACAGANKKEAAGAIRRPLFCCKPLRNTAG